MPADIESHLAFLYGAARSRPLADRVEALLDRWRPQRPSRDRLRTPTPLAAADALLIAYADQVRDPDVPPLRALASFAQRHLAGLVSGLHLLPFYPWSSDDGFSVKDYARVDPDCGTWDDIARLGMDFDLMFDGVFNHLSARSEWFQAYLAQSPAYRNFFVSVEGTPDLSAVIRPRTLPLLTEFQTPSGPCRVWTTFGPDQVDLNFKNPEVLLAVLDALLLYVCRGARFIRLDAIAFLWKEIGTSCLHLPQTHRVVQLMRTVLDVFAPGVRLITETNVPHVDNLSYFGDGTNEAQLVYNFALPPLVLHSLQTGDARCLTSWARFLRLPSDQVTFFNFLASHDGIGLNPARGLLTDAEIDALVERTLARGGYISFKNLPDGAQAPYEMNINYLDALTPSTAPEPPALTARRFLTAQSIMLSLQGMPGIYFHSLVGSRGDRPGAETSGIKRRINREKPPLARLEAELATPDSLRSLVYTGYAQLLRQRRQHTAFAPDSAQRILELDPRVFAVVRECPQPHDRVACLHNVSGESVTVSLPSPNGSTVTLDPWAHRWIDVPEGIRL